LTVGRSSSGRYERGLHFRVFGVLAIIFLLSDFGKLLNGIVQIQGVRIEQAAIDISDSAQGNISHDLFFTVGN